MADGDLHVHFHFNVRRGGRKMKRRLAEIAATLTSLKEFTMASASQLQASLQAMHDLVVQVLALIKAEDAERDDLKQQLAAAVAGLQISETEKTALQTAIDNAFTQSDQNVNELRAGVPGVPPVGGNPLASSFDSASAFNDAVAAYGGPESVTLDGTTVKDGSTPSLDYFSHSDDGSVNTSGPTD